MRKLLYIVPAALLTSTAALTPTPALALPTCEQEVRIRCSGYSVAGRPRLDIYYNSFEDCVRGEQPLRCGTQPDEDDLTPVAFNVRTRQSGARVA